MDHVAQKTKVSSSVGSPSRILQQLALASLGKQAEGGGGVEEAIVEPVY
jgi:hypothetical protein